jgi:hypothetical protein
MLRQQGKWEAGDATLHQKVPSNLNLNLNLNLTLTLTLNHNLNLPPGINPLGIYDQD